jgi:hypothetical protein
MLRHRNVQHAGGDPQMRAHIASDLTVIAQPAKPVGTAAFLPN